MWTLKFLIWGYCTTVYFVDAAIVDSCLYQPCKWTASRYEEDASTVIVDDESVHNVNWKWDVRGGHWNVTYHYRYPSEYYTGKIVFVNCSVVPNRKNAFVTWGSNDPWTSNAVPVYANAWNITYNGDIFGFVPTQNGQYVIKIYTKNKSHNPFGTNEPIIRPSGQCTFSSNDPVQNSAWWIAQKAKNTCAEPALVWNWNGNNGKWTVLYRYVAKTDSTLCDVFYQRDDMVQPVKAITWELNESKQTVTYAANPIRIYESAWRHTLSPTESWGFVPLGDGLWDFQFYTRKLVFHPFKNLRALSQINPTLLTTIGSPGY
ncbi:Hypothetical protein NTJ_00438 [Nesidiocoris tenuis]|uniref:Uncharacterized protein n=1 Tax=Nesidiocoris tenuis TaxID=355587 RepID=A0ABN7A6S2_9HEMI|nr:Hypothetical protein NTJ_00438 [Nesidiocoris tenuis]